MSATTPRDQSLDKQTYDCSSLPLHHPSAPPLQLSRPRLMLAPARACGPRDRLGWGVTAAACLARDTPKGRVPLDKESLTRHLCATRADPALPRSHSRKHAEYEKRSHELEIEVGHA